MIFLKYIFLLLLSLRIQPFLCSNYTKTFEKNTSRSTLILAHVLFRHGARNILKDSLKAYENDPWKDEKHWRGGYGALINQGKKQAYKLGKFLLKRYKRLIGNEYSPKKVYIRSTDVDRTLMTAQCCAAALFHPSGDEVWNNKINWQPIPIHTVGKYEDYLLYPMPKCPRFEKIYEEHLSSPEMKVHLEENRAMIDFIEKNSRSNITTLLNIILIYDSLYIERLQGLKLPKWANQLLNSHEETLHNLTGIHFGSYTHTTEMKTLMAGYLIKEMIDRFNEKISSDSTTDLSLVLYSSHDMKITQILDSLNLNDMKIPPYTSSLHFELYKRNKSYFVQIFYRKPPSKKLTLLEIPSCGKMCSLEKFYELYKHILPTESFSSACASE